MDHGTTPRTLHIARKLLSLLGNIQITDNDGNLLYECAASWSWFARTWHIRAQGREIARMRRKLFTLVRAWDVDTGDERFVLQDKLFSWRRQVTVRGGSFDGAVLRGGLLDMRFELSHHGQIIAKADADLLTLRTRHSIVLLQNSPQAERLTAILMANLLIQKSADNQMTGADPGPFTSQH